MKYVGALFLMLVTFFSFGQRKPSYLQLGVSANSYNGELGSYSDWSAGFQGSIIFNKKKKLNGAFNFGLGSITGEDGNFGSRENTNDPAPNTFVNTHFLFLNYDLRFNLVKKQNWGLYLSQGIGFIRFTPEDEFGEGLETQDQTREPGETYRNLAVMLPTSLGAMYFLPNDFGVSLQLGLFNTGTDYIDNISELGESGNDNILSMRLALLVPLKD